MGEHRSIILHLGHNTVVAITSTTIRQTLRLLALGAAMLFSSGCCHWRRCCSFLEPRPTIVDQCDIVIPTGSANYCETSWSTVPTCCSAEGYAVPYMTEVHSHTQLHSLSDQADVYPADALAPVDDLPAYDQDIEQVPAPQPAVPALPDVSADDSAVRIYRSTAAVQSVNYEAEQVARNSVARNQVDRHSEQLRSNQPTSVVDDTRDILEFIRP